MLDYTGFEELLSEMQAKANELITEKGAEILSEFHTAEIKLGDVKREIARSERKLKSLHEKIDEMEKAEVGDIPEEYIKKFVAKYTKGFAPGDTVYTLREHTGTKKCSVCEGKKQLEVKNPTATEIFLADCPKCNGRGTIIKSYYAVKKERIEDVSLKLFFEKDQVCVWSYDTVRLYGDDYSRGVIGLYNNLEEAEAEAKKLMEDNNA